MSRQQPQEQADAARTIHSKENVDMQAAIQECEKCHDVCVSTMTHGLDQGSRHAEPIEPKWLEAVPWTPYCLKHQNELATESATRTPSL